MIEQNFQGPKIECNVEVWLTNLEKFCIKKYVPFNELKSKKCYNFFE